MQQVAKRYAGFNAVDDLTFSVTRGSFFSILGPSGCGKTTLLRMVAGFLSPDAGAIHIGGKPMAGVAPNRRPVNMVFQHLALFPMMSVGDNVGYGLARRGVASSEIKRRVADMLERVSLPGVQDKRIEQLSGGQKQRIAIARSLVLEPTLLLLDEPLGALDLKLREHMKIELKQLQAAFGTTFVYITHDQSEALVMSDHVAVMNRGRFEQLGTPQQLYYEPQTAFVAGFVGANNRVAGRATALEAGVVTLVNPLGLELRARAIGPVRRGRRRRGLCSARGCRAVARCALRWARPDGYAARARSRACSSTARIRPCCCTSRRRASSSASRCRRPASSPTCAWARPCTSVLMRSAPCVLLLPRRRRQAMRS